MEKPHVEFRYRARDSETVIVFVHGIMGSPLQFDYLIQGLDGIYSIENLLLPGHGGTAVDFRKSGMSRWQDYLDERIRRLQDEYQNIVLVGHSMGCLLSVQTALSHPRKIRGLFFTALPLKIHISFPFIKNNFMAAFCENSKSEIVAAARRGNSVSARHPLAHLAALPRYTELLNKCRATRKLMERLRQPVIVLQSEKDEIVSAKSLRYIKESQNIRTAVLKDAGHYHYPPEARAQIAQALERFIPEVTQSATPADANQSI